MRNPPILAHSFHLDWSDHMISDKNYHEELFFKAKMEKGYHSFFVSSLQQDEIGLSDLKERSEKAERAGGDTNDDKKYWLANATGFNFSSGGRLGSINNTTCTLIANRIFLGCEQMLAQAKMPGERLIAYIWRARELEITHQLPDGNGRTAITTLIKSIADDKDLPNYIPENPNILDCQSPEAILRQVYSGMVRFKVLSGESVENMISVEELIDQAKIRGLTWGVVHARAELSDEQIKKLVAEDRKEVAGAHTQTS